MSGPNHEFRAPDRRSSFDVTAQEVRLVLRFGYLLFLISRSDEGLWPGIASPFEGQIGRKYVRTGTPEAEIRKTSTILPSPTVSSFVVEAIFSVTHQPGPECLSAINALSRYRNDGGAYG